MGNNDAISRARDEIRPRWEEILKQITSPAKEKSQGRTTYICPFCGHGANGDGLALNPKSKSGYGLHCFGNCEFSGDIIDLIKKYENIESFPESVRRAGAYIGIDPDTYTQPESQRKPAQKQTKNERDTDMNIHTDTYTHTDTDAQESQVAYYRQCMSQRSGTDYLRKRGISEKTGDRFMVGYDPHFKVAGGEWQALIIPIGKSNYVARNTDPNASGKDRYRNRGTSTCFNQKALETATKPIIITEGELDALSIIEAGGEAIGLGSTSNVGTFLRLAEKTKPAQPLILALDNDEKGQQATEELAKGLADLEIPFYWINLYQDAKDANEALIKDREALIREVSKAEQTVEEAEKEAEEAERKEYLKTSAEGYLQAFINGIADSVNTPAQPTGFTELDSVLDGGLYEGLYIVGAITSLGKTTLALQIADQIAESGRDVLIFSLEMSRYELMSKSISRLTLLDVLADPNGNIRNAKTNRGITAGTRYETYSKEERDLIQRAISAYGTFASHIYIKEGVGDIGVEQLRETVETHIKYTGQAPIVLVDYLQILAPYNPRATDKQNTDKSVLELKRLSRDFKIPVIGISSLNRGGYDEPVSMEAFKESGAIEYGSDVLIGLQLNGVGEKGYNATEAKKKDPREVDLVILKNRNGQTGDKIMFSYYPKFNYFKEDKSGGYSWD